MVYRIVLLLAVTVVAAVEMAGSWDTGQHFIPGSDVQQQNWRLVIRHHSLGNVLTRYILHTDVFCTDYFL